MEDLLGGFVACLVFLTALAIAALGIAWLWKIFTWLLPA